MPFPPTPSNTPSNTPTPSITPSYTPTNTPTTSSCPVSQYVTQVSLIDCEEISLDNSGWELQVNGNPYTTLTTNTSTTSVWCGIGGIQVPVFGTTYTFELTQIPFGWELCEFSLYGIFYDKIDVVIGTLIGIDCSSPTECIEEYNATFNYYLNGVLQYSSPETIQFYNYLVAEPPCPLGYLMFSQALIFYVKRNYITPTPTPTQTQTPTGTVVPTATPSNTPSQTSTIGSTPPPTPTMTQTPSPTACNNVTAVFGYMEPCIGGTIDDHMGAAVQVQNNVSVDTTFEVYVYYQNPGGSCNPATNLSQYFQVTIPAGDSSSNFNACSFGAYFPSGAVVCDACIISCDNPSICIPNQFLC